ncbi:hypothetical protein GGI04_004490 [Coemansia thaxteri]|nr:hypothetical protein GGI04_004490 [Coemansia thaxteri]
MCREGANDTAQDLVMRLPFDLAVLVSKQLAPKDMYQCLLVCRAWNQLFSNSSNLLPLVRQLSHFDQEPMIFRCLQTGHAHEHDGGEVAETSNEDEDAEVIKDPKAAAEAERAYLEEMANQQWLKNNKVLARFLSKTLNRERRWRRAEPTSRLYLPPVPMDGTDSDVLEEWQGPVQTVKMKGGLVVVLYKKGANIRIWNLDSEYDEVKEMANQYISDNREAILAQKKHSGVGLPPYAPEQIDALLRCARSGVPRRVDLRVIKMRSAPILFDFFTLTNILVTATDGGEVDLYDMVSGAHQRTFRIEGDLRIGSIHVWMDYLVVGHGTQITLWNHKTGERLESELQTAHRASINGIFILDNEQHLMSIDECGIMVVTNRSARRPETQTLLDVPLYPMIMVGQMGAPYAMRLLHMSHLCVWGKYSLGHYELYEPGLRHLPPLSSLQIIPARNGEGEETPEAAVPDPAVPAESATASLSKLSKKERKLVESRQTLAQLEATHQDLERMYSEIAGDRNNEHPEGERVARRRLNRVPAEDKYHIINIDPPADMNPDALVLSVDFRHVIYLHRYYVSVHELQGQDAEADDMGRMCSMGLQPIDPRPKQAGPPRRPPPPFKAATGAADPPGAAALWHVHTNGEGAEAASDDGDENYIDADNDLGDELDNLFDPDARLPADLFLRHLREGSWNKAIGELFQGDQSAKLRQIELLGVQILISLQAAVENKDHDAAVAAVPYEQSARKFLREHMPELLDEFDAGTDLAVLLPSVSYYAQRLHESHFAHPVLNFDHRGQVTTAARLHRDMERLSRAARLHTTGVDGEWGRTPGFVTRASMSLRHEASAMDDGRIAIGCANGYVVVASFD